MTDDGMSFDDAFGVDADDPGIAAYSAEPEYIFVPHEHTDDCYQEVQELTCREEEHEHTDDCFDEYGAQRIDADGARTAQEDDRAGEAVFPFGRRKFCDIADHAFPGAKKGSPETSPVLAFRRRYVPRRSVFPCPCGQGCNKRESLLQGKVGLRAGRLEEGRENVHGESFPFLSQAFLQCNPF